MDGEIIRCPWADRSPLERAYHDRVWGVPLHDEQGLFGMLCLEGMQAGLSLKIQGMANIGGDRLKQLNFMEIIADAKVR